jgi:hypothetical protein
MDYTKAQNQLLKAKGLGIVKPDTLKYLKEPIGKSIALTVGRPRIRDDKKAKATDKVKCPVCGGIFSRSNRSAHKKTKYHTAYEQFDSKIRNLMLADNIDVKHTI